MVIRSHYYYRTVQFEQKCHKGLNSISDKDKYITMYSVLLSFLKEREQARYYLVKFSLPI